jgi:hypothetical protein
MDKALDQRVTGLENVDVWAGNDHHLRERFAASQNPLPKANAGLLCTCMAPQVREVDWHCAVAIFSLKLNKPSALLMPDLVTLMQWARTQLSFHQVSQTFLIL